LKRNATLWLSIVVFGCLVFPRIVVSQDVEESISANSFLAIQAAVTELERYQLNVAGYRIVVLDSGSTIFVGFQNPNPRRGQMGNPGPKPALTVELSRDGLEVIGSHFER
jgi:hypothetical protein